MPQEYTISFADRVCVKKSTWEEHIKQFVLWWNKEGRDEGDGVAKKLTATWEQSRLCTPSCKRKDVTKYLTKKQTIFSNLWNIIQIQLQWSTTVFTILCLHCIHNKWCVLLSHKFYCCFSWMEQSSVSEEDCGLKGDKIHGEQVKAVHDIWVLHFDACT